MTERVLTVAVLTAIVTVIAALGADETRLQQSCVRFAPPISCQQW